MKPSQKLKKALGRIIQMGRNDGMIVSLSHPLSYAHALTSCGPKRLSFFLGNSGRSGTGRGPPHEEYLEGCPDFNVKPREAMGFLLCIGM